MGRVVVVGGGIGGLAVAVWLADYGHDVVVLERRSRLGGQLDIALPGPATLTVPAVFRDLFAKTGRRLDREVTMRAVDPAIGYVTSAGHVALPHASRSGSLAAMRDGFGDAAAAEWDRVLRRAADVWQIARPTLVDARPMRRIRAGLTAGRKARSALFGTIAELLTAADVSHPAIREIAAAHAISSGADPRDGPAFMVTGPYLEQTFGVWTVEGGPQALVEALAGRARERGAELRPGVAATRFETDRGRVVAVHTRDGDRIRADTVVSAVPHTEHARLLGRRPESGPRAARSVCSIVVPHSPAHSGTILRTIATPTDRYPFCVVEHSGDGATVVHVDVAATARVDDLFAEAVLGDLSDRGVDLGPTAGRPTVHGPDHWATELGLGAGSPYGPALASRWSLMRRPGPTTSIHGLFRVGAATRPGPGVHAVALSAAVTADLIGTAGSGTVSPVHRR